MDFLITLANRPWFFPVVGGLIAAYLLTLSVTLALWTLRDARRRVLTRGAQVGAALFVLAFGLVGFVAYVALRPRRTLEERHDDLRERALLARAVARATCPSCKQEVESDFASCPFCKVDFAPVCTSCGGVVQLSWKRCGFCGTEVGADVRSRKFASPVPLSVDVLEAAALTAAKQQLSRAAATKPVGLPVLFTRLKKSSAKPIPVAPKSLPIEPAPAPSNVALTLQRFFSIKR